jgi:hypothetical protein
LAFTAAKDRKLITWNLVKGRPAFITNLKGIAEFLVCSPDGARYFPHVWFGILSSMGRRSIFLLSLVAQLKF